MAAEAAESSVAAPLKRPPEAQVVFDPDPRQIGAKVDWSRWCLTDEDDMGEGGEQFLIIKALLSMLAMLLEERGRENVHIGADQFFAWIESEPLVRVSPDVYLLDDPPPRPLPASWQTWREGHRPPRLAVEIVSEGSWKKDYEDNPLKYAQLGAAELVIFDPHAAVAEVKGEERLPLQVFRREADGRFARVERGAGPVYSRELDAWLLCQVDGAVATLAVSYDSAGRQLVPTVEQARKAAEARQAAEREARQAAEEKLAAALAELEKLRGGG